MRLKRPPDVASNPEPAGGHRAGAGVARILSVTAVAVAACAMGVLPAMASPAGDPGSVATTTTVTAPAANVYSYVHAGQSFNVTATVTAADGSVPTGTVAFTLVEYPGTPPAALECTGANAATLVNGTATCTVTTGVGDYGFVLYEATYTPTAASEWTTSNSLGSGDHKLVTWDITSTKLTFNPATATAGDPVKLTADVTDQGNDALSAAFSATPDLVTFSIGGVAIPGCANVPVTDTEAPPVDPDNIATCTYTPATSGPVAIEAAYSGDQYALPSSATETLKVNGAVAPKVSSKTTASASPKTAKTRQNVKLSATVKSSGTTPTGTVTFWLGSRKLCVAKVSKGKASCGHAFTRASKKKITARYSGDSTHDASSGTVTVTVRRR
jgi:Bacterial Ig-like domain (group 3)